jgi:DICT domain-containing protein
MEQRRYFLAFLGIYTLDLHVADKAATLAENFYRQIENFPKKNLKSQRKQSSGVAQ